LLKFSSDSSETSSLISKLVAVEKEGLTFLFEALDLGAEQWFALPVPMAMHNLDPTWRI
jgi:hypothetical protein